MAGNAHLQQVGEAGVSVGHVALRAALDIHQGHDDEAEGAEGLIDAGGLAQPLPRRPRALLPLAACTRATHRFHYRRPYGEIRFTFKCRPT